MIRGEPQDHALVPFPSLPLPGATAADSGADPQASGDRIARFLKEVASIPERSAQVQCLRVIPARPARHGGENFTGTPSSDPHPGAGENGAVEDGEPLGLHPRWHEYLAGQGISRLWIHQAKAIRLALAGRNVVVVTSTASGKTLCYNVPVLERFLRAADGAADAGAAAG